MSGYILVLTTVPGGKDGQKIAQALVEERLAACVTLLGAGISFYWWDDKISKEEEHVLLIKTKESLYPELEKKILAIHPYQIPEIIALPVVKGLAKYLDWLLKETR